ncbi:MAG: hypothetical protein WKF77_22035 [Planctomycetaceae bacterium]
MPSSEGVIGLHRNQGSEFIVRLPVFDQQPRKPMPSSSEAFTAVKIIVADKSNSPA